MSELANLLGKLREDHDLHLIAESLADAVLRQERELTAARNHILEEAAAYLEAQDDRRNGRWAAAKLRQLKNHDPRR